ncbi:hypothetical protein OQA88_11884 [Cercophora sp. LCS_1]
MELDLSDSTRSAHSQWAYKLACAPLANKLHNQLPLSDDLLGAWPEPTPEGQPLPDAPEYKIPGTGKIANPRVAIVGAGAAGLFTAMILDYLNQKCADDGFNVAYDIFEAAEDRSRLGGRLYTHNFSLNPDSRHNYFDVGAMRFPDASDQAPNPNPIMKRVFDLFKKLGMNPVPSVDGAPLGSLVPYQMENDVTSGSVTSQQEYYSYNNITQLGSYTSVTAADTEHDPFDINAAKAIPDRIFTQSPGAVLNAAIADFRNILKDPGLTPEQAWQTLMTYDQLTTRQALVNPPPPPETASKNRPKAPTAYDYETVQWLETFNAGTGWYDQALSEAVLESLDFEFNDDSSKNTWRCILGGAQQLAINMAATLQGNQPQFGQRVTAIRATNKLEMQIDIAGTTVPAAYNGVFNSTTLGCLGRIDTTGVNLDYPVREAIRTLSYGPSAKIGILFDHAWWKFDLGATPDDTTYNIKNGGLGHSDLNLRTVVYPSYNGDLTPTQPAVLLCSYTWQQDALRMGSLMSSSRVPAIAEAEEQANGLKALLIRELALLHHTSTSPKSLQDIESIIANSWTSHFSHDWTHDPNCAGAFAFFGPSQFRKLWPSLIQPTGNLIIIGEAASPHHAWVVGALESAVYGVYSWLKLRRGDIQGATSALTLLGAEESGNPFVGLPDYMDANMAAWAAIFGNFAEEAWIEKYSEK